jgi:flavorubredoxin
MKVLVMHDSRYGNGKQVAEAIAEGLREGGQDAQVAGAGEVKELDLSTFGAFVLGTPIRVGSPTWRAGGALKRLGKMCRGRNCVAFVTQADPKMWGLPRWEARVAAAGLAKLMEGKGFHVMAPRGPLEDGELPKAKEFGKEIAGKLK